MKKKNIILISNELIEKDNLNALIESITFEYKYPVVIKKIEFDLSNFYYPGRRQYDANNILKVLSEIPFPDSIKKVGIFKVDLFIPILTFIFGQAILNGDTGIISPYRLRNELYGLEQNKALLNERLIKVVIHELGHMFGLIHCANPICVMRSSTYVEDIDQKQKHLCTKCRSKIGF